MHPKNSTWALCYLLSPPALSYPPGLWTVVDDDEDAHDSAGELEVTGEGTAGGPFGLKRVLFVRKKSEKTVLSREV